MNESEALAQFSRLDNIPKCAKCATKLLKNHNVYPQAYFVADYGKPQIQVCETCFDTDIKQRWGYF